MRVHASGSSRKEEDEGHGATREPPLRAPLARVCMDPAEKLATHPGQSGLGSASRFTMPLLTMGSSPTGLASPPPRSSPPGAPCRSPLEAAPTLSGRRKPQDSAEPRHPSSKLCSTRPRSQEARHSHEARSIEERRIAQDEVPPSQSSLIGRGKLHVALVQVRKRLFFVHEAPREQRELRPSPRKRSSGISFSPPENSTFAREASSSAAETRSLPAPEASRAPPEALRADAKACAELTPSSAANVRKPGINLRNASSTAKEGGF